MVADDLGNGLPLSCAIDFRNVLVVDDEDMLLTLYKEMFKILGCRALITNNPATAIELLENNQDIDLLCTDLNMPDMDGLQLAERCHAIRPEIPIILCSELTTDLKGEELEQIGIRLIATKPITLQGLEHALGQLARKDMP